MYRRLIAYVVYEEEEGPDSGLNYMVTAHGGGMCGSASPHKEVLNDSTASKAEASVQNLILKQQTEVIRWCFDVLQQWL